MKGKDMTKKSLFVVLFAMLCLAVFTVSVSADQDGYERYCNSDQYGCWVTGDEGEQIYIMFWSESARDLFMGPGSNAVVADPFPAGKMSLGKGSTPVKSLTDTLRDLISDIYTAAGMEKYINSDAAAMAYDLEHGYATMDDILSFLDRVAQY